MKNLGVAMNILKRSALMTLSIFFAIPAVYAEDVVSLPTIRVMAESELREEVGFVPFQEDQPVRQALQHRVEKIHSDIQSEQIKDNPVGVEYQAKAPQPDMSQLPPVFQDYILAVAQGFQSPDPTEGVFRMLAPLKITRENAGGYRDGSIKINMNDVLQLQQQLQNALSKNY